MCRANEKSTPASSTQLRGGKSPAPFILADPVFNRNLLAALVALDAAPFHADPGLVSLTEEIAAQRPELGAYPGQINGGNTEMADALRLGVPAITIGGQTGAGDLPRWQQVGDTFDKMVPEVPERAYAFTRAFIEALDARAGA